VLRVKARHLEDGAPADAKDALEAELATLAGWLELDAVTSRGA
jgi:uncharacterized protein YcaQ